MKENRYILSFIIFLLGSLSIHSQTHSDLRTTVEEALVSLKPEHLAIGEIKLDTLLLEKGNKLVVLMNDEFSYLPIIEKDESIEVSQFTLKEVIRQPIFSIADSDSNKTYSWISSLSKRFSLVEMIATGIVYVKDTRTNTYQPFISGNGKYCKYDNEKGILVEI